MTEWVDLIYVHTFDNHTDPSRYIGMRKIVKSWNEIECMYAVITCTSCLSSELVIHHHAPTDSSFRPITNLVTNQVANRFSYTIKLLFLLSRLRCTDVCLTTTWDEYSCLNLATFSTLLNFQQCQDVKIVVQLQLLRCCLQ